MKKLIYIIAAMAFIVCAKAQVGIGTAVPDTNAVLDISSPIKGFLIPRIVDTGIVANPLEGMIIYNKNTKTPYYHNGRQWISLGGRLPNGMTSSTDRITYQVSGAGFSGTEEAVFSLSHGVSIPTTIGGGGITAGTASLSSFNLAKEFDINSKSMNMASVLGTIFASIEFKVYATGSLVPYVSYRYKNIIVESYQVSGSAGGGPLIESVSIAFENYGMKDWVNNFEFGYNLVTKTITAY